MKFWLLVPICLAWMPFWADPTEVDQRIVEFKKAFPEYTDSFSHDSAVRALERFSNINPDEELTTFTLLAMADAPYDRICAELSRFSDETIVDSANAAFIMYPAPERIFDKEWWELMEVCFFERAKKARSPVRRRQLFNLAVFLNHGLMDRYRDCAANTRSFIYRDYSRENSFALQDDYITISEEIYQFCEQKE